MRVERGPNHDQRESRAGPLLCWYGDDFTGATDTLAALAHARLSALLFMGVPTPAQLSAVGPLDAVGIAGAARAMSPEAMLAELTPVGQFFADLAVPVLHYKVCSTFDSSPTTGSIGAAIRALRPHVVNGFVPIVGGQPNIGRYCAFSNLFAAAGLGGVVHRIDRHPTMSRHPVTPMHEADLRVHLAAQGLREIGAVHYPAYEASEAAQDALLDAELARLASASGADIHPVLFDVAQTAHLAAVGRLIWQNALRRRLLAVGSSSVVQALAAHLGAVDGAAGDAARGSAVGALSSINALNALSAGASFAVPALEPAKGPVFVLSGSMSPVTARQVEAATGYERRPVDASRLVGDGGYADQLVASVTNLLRAERNVLIFTAAQDGAAADVAQASEVARASEVAQATATLVARIVKRMAPVAPLRRVGIAGGDTSSHVAQALGIWGLSYQTTMAPGVTLSRAHSADPALDGLELMLKGGQMGDSELFGRLVTGDQGK